MKTDWFEENLHIISSQDMQDEERIDYLLSVLSGLTNSEREFLLEHGFNPDTGERYD